MKTILKAETPTLSAAQKFANLPQTTKLAVYGGSGAAGALLLGAFLFVCIRQRRAGKMEREAYNAKVEKEREEAYQYQMELKDKGFGGWNSGEVNHQGEDALGGWGGSHSASGARSPDVPPVPKVPNFSVNEIQPLYNTSPNIPRSPGFPSPNGHPGAFNSGGYQRF
jgi:hypothetical protein